MLGLVAGVVGGLGTGAIAGLRRADSAATRLIVATRTPEVVLALRGAEHSTAELQAVIEQQPETARVWPFRQMTGRTTASKDWYAPIAGPARVPGGYQPVLDEGRMPDDRAPNEVVVSVETARHTGLRPGSHIGLDLYAPEQLASIEQDSERAPTGPHLELEVVGIVRESSDIVPGSSERFILGSAALYEAYGRLSPAGAGYAVTLVGGDADIESFRAGVSSHFPADALDVAVSRDVLAQTEEPDRALRVSVLALAVLIGLFGLVVVRQGVRRLVVQNQADESTLASLGLTRSDRVWATTISGGVAALTGGAATVVVAILISPAFPLGRPHSLEPAPGVEVNVAVILVGALLTALGVLVVHALAGRAVSRPPRPARPRAVVPSPMAIGWTASVAGWLGASLAVDGRRGRTAARTHASGRGAIVGATIGTVGLVAISITTANVHALLTTPPSYGNDFDVSIEVPDALALSRRAELEADPDIEAVAEQRAASMRVNEISVAGVANVATKGTVAATVRSGRLPRASDEIALGPSIARELGVGPGDEVAVGVPGATTSFTVVGTVLDPRRAHEDYTSVAVLGEQALQRVAQRPLTPLLVVRYREGVDHAAKSAELDRRYPYGVVDESFPNPPGALQNLDAAATVPTMLAWFFAGTIVVSLANGLLVAGRRDRHTLTVSRALGFTSSQVRSTMVAMAVTTVGAALVIGVPIGLAIGRVTWTVLATRIEVQPAFVWPVALLVALTPVLLLVGTAISWWPAHRISSRAPGRDLWVE